MKKQKPLPSTEFNQACGAYSKMGFTLIELVIVIAIIGILAAVAVPKFFDMKSVAQQANKDKIIGIIRSGLSSYSSDQLAKNNQKVFPATADLRLENILDEIPD
ncbi:MAG: type II secretion system protein, partial [FCB group bacterium]|nr:type II secretion system protein [FCB group bacterium]